MTAAPSWQSRAGTAHVTLPEVGRLEDDDARDWAMNSHDDKPTREEATYAAVLGFIRRNVYAIGWLAPLPVVFLLPRDGPWAVALVLLYLGEVIAYRILAGPGAFLFGRNPRILVTLGALGFVALTQLIVWVRDR